MVILYARRQDHQFNTLTSAILSYKSIIYKTHKDTNQYIFLTMSPSANTRSGSTTSKETPDIFPNTSTSLPSLSKSHFGKIHNDIKSITDKHHADTKDLNDHIFDMLENLLIQVLRRTSKKNNSQIFHPNSQPMKTS